MIKSDEQVRGDTGQQEGISVPVDLDGNSLILVAGLGRIAESHLTVIKLFTGDHGATQVQQPNVGAGFPGYIVSFPRESSNVWEQVAFKNARS